MQRERNGLLVAQMKLKSVHVVVVGRPESRRLLRRLVRKWRHVIKTELEKVGHDVYRFISLRTGNQ